MNCKRIGVDLAKNVFQLHGVDHKEHSVLARKLRRSEMSSFLVSFPHA